MTRSARSQRRRAAAAGLLEHVEVLAGHQLGPHRVEHRPGRAGPSALEAAAWRTARRSRPGRGHRAGSPPRRRSGSRVAGPAALLVQRREPPVHGGPAAAGVATVHHVVVDQAAAWQQLQRRPRRSTISRAVGARRRRASPSSRRPGAAACRRERSSRTPSSRHAHLGTDLLQPRLLPGQVVIDAFCSRAPQVLGVQRVAGAAQVEARATTAGSASGLDGTVSTPLRVSARPVHGSGGCAGSRHRAPTLGAMASAPGSVRVAAAAPSRRCTRASASCSPAGPRRTPSSSSRPRPTRARRRCGRRSAGWSRCGRRSCR